MKKDGLEEEQFFKLYVSTRNTKYYELLDSKNAILVFKNPDQTLHEEKYIMVHYKLVAGNPKAVNYWYMNDYALFWEEVVIKELNLFRVPKAKGGFSALYDYENARFVVPLGDFDLLQFDCGEKFLKQYNGILASFSLSSDYEEDDVISYINPITNQKIEESFEIRDGIYYAVLNFDGTIRGNKLFKGKNFSKIESVIDLNEYDSLEKFKKERKKFCNDKKRQRKQEYGQMIQSRDDDSISPYLDSEVIKVLELKK